MSRSAAGGTAAAPRARIWSTTFALLCAAQLLGYAHTGVLTPIVPLYVASLGYSELVVGLVLAAFSLSSFVLRPFIGYLADHWSVRGVLGLGGLLLGSAGLALSVPVVWVVGLVNMVRGVGWAALNTGGNTMLAHLAPPTRRAEAASYLNLFQNTPAFLLPPLSLWLLGAPLGGFGSVFVLSGLLGLGTLALSLTMARAHAEPRRAPSAAGGGGASGLIDRAVLLPSMMLFCLTLVQPAASAFIPLYARSLGLEVQDVAWYYGAGGVASLFGRALMGRLADTLGRGASLALGFGFALLGLLLLLLATSLPLLVVGGVAYSLGTVLHFPSALALAIDRADPRRRGVALASYSLWFQVGMGVGSALAGAVVDLAGYRAMYLLTFLPPLAGLALVAANWPSLRKQAPSVSVSGG